MYENKPKQKTPIPFLEPPPPCGCDLISMIYPNVDGNWENSPLSSSHMIMVLCTNLHWYVRNCSAKNTRHDVNGLLQKLMASLTWDP